MLPDGQQASWSFEGTTGAWVLFITTSLPENYFWVGFFGIAYNLTPNTTCELFLSVAVSQVSVSWAGKGAGCDVFQTMQVLIS